MAVGRRVLAEGGSATDIVTEIMDVRYGETRRTVALSPHALELNDQAFRRARDIMIEAAIGFQKQLADLLTELDQQPLIRLKPTTTADTLAQALCDGARGSNQTLPPIPTNELRGRYRNIISAILFGTLEPETTGKL